MLSCNSPDAKMQHCVALYDQGSVLLQSHSAQFPVLAHTRLNVESLDVALTYHVMQVHAKKKLLARHTSLAHSLSHNPCLRTEAEDALRLALRLHNTVTFSKPLTASVMEARCGGIMFWKNWTYERKLDGLTAYQGKTSHWIISVSDVLQSLGASVHLLPVIVSQDPYGNFD